MSDYRFEIRQSKDGLYYWHFVAPNNEICCVSHMYTTKEHAVYSARVMKTHAAEAPIVDDATEHKGPAEHNEGFLEEWSKNPIGYFT
jgi:uncharacterized protein YegP (UPF0339 family)